MFLNCSNYLFAIYGYPIYPNFPNNILVLMVLNSCPIVSENLVCYAKWYRFFQVKQYNMFDN